MSDRLTFRRPPEVLPSPPGDAAGEPLPSWSVLCAPGTVRLDRPSPRALRTLEAGTPVAVCLDGPLARRRLRRLARRAALQIDRELIAVPRTARPIAVFDDEETAVRHFWSSIVTVPPGVSGLAPLLTLALCGARRLPWSWTGAITPARVIIGRRS